MMQGIGAPIDFNSFDRGIYSRKSSSHLVIAGVALVASLSAGFWALSQRATPQSEIAAAPAAAPVAQSAQNPYGAIIGLGGRPQSLAFLATRGTLDASISPAAHTPSAIIPERQDLDAMQMAAAPAESVEEAEVAPLPPRRPVELSIADRGLYESSLQRMARTSVVPASPADNRSIFDKVFGLGDAAQEARQQQQPKGQALAYAAPDGGTLSDLKSGILGGVSGAAGAAVGPAARYDRYTAVYDISAHTVYLPNGVKLEAHSGLREHLDDPRFVHLRMRGATPPHVYDLSPREALFHGVQALRLTPIGGEGAIFGRAGLLAHTYMLGPNGDSNGCVSFRDYQAFLRAYKNGEVRRLAVVAHL